MINTLINWLVSIIETLGYPGVALSMFVESFFAPIPSEVVLPFSGFVASKGVLNLYLVIAVATIAAYLGSLPFYIIGRVGEGAVHRFLEKYGKYLFISENDLKKGYCAFDRYGNLIVLFGRVIPIIRTLVSFPAGASKMNFVVFTIYTIAGTAVWSTVLIVAGYLLGNNWEIVGNYVSKYEYVIIIILSLCVIAYITYGLSKMRREKTNKS